MNSGTCSFLYWRTLLRARITFSVSVNSLFSLSRDSVPFFSTISTSFASSFSNLFKDMNTHCSLAPAEETSAVLRQGNPRPLDLTGSCLTIELRCQLEDLRKTLIRR